MLEELGRDAYVRALTDHRRLLREVLGAHGGIEVEMQGDSFHFAFVSARRAVEAAVAGQQALQEHVWESEPIRVRIGLHSGEPLQADGLYAGLDVHQAARIMSAAHGGQVVLSQRTAELAGGDLDLALLDLGEHRLKDLSTLQRLYQPVIDGLPADFPPLRTLHVRRLPVPANRLIGRREELNEIARRLAVRETRLLTLTGTGGTGKTRVALQAAAELSEHFDGGAHFVSLAAIHDPSLVLPTVAKSLGVREQVGQTIAELLGDHLGQQATLLVLDNFEQVIEAASDVGSLLGASPTLSLLVTSREPLRIGGEQCFAVPALVDDDALALFVERARAADDHFELNDANATDVGAICRLLDGVPLAIELAAARVGVLTTQGLLGRLDRSLELLTSGRRDADVRQQTMRSTIAWSYDLLSESEQRTLARLSVFAAGFTAEEAETICQAGIDDVAALVEQSLLRRDSVGDGEPGFRYLRVIREYAVERLESSREADAVRRRHALAFLELAREADSALRGEDAAEWLTRVESRHDEFRAALGWARNGDGDLLLALALALGAFWQVHGHLAEASAWFEEALAHAVRSSDGRLLATLQEAAEIAYLRRDYGRAEPLMQRMLALSREKGDHRAAVVAFSKLASLSAQLGEHERASAYNADALATARAAGDEPALMIALNNLGNLELLHGRHARAAELFEEALQLVRVVGRRDSVAAVLFSVGLATLLAGEPERAAAPLKESLRLSHDLGDRETVAYALEGLAAVAVAQQRQREAAVLLGGADGLLEACDATLETVELALHERTEAAARAALTVDYDVAWAEGRGLSAAALVESVAPQSADVAVQIP